MTKSFNLWVERQKEGLQRPPGDGDTFLNVEKGCLFLLTASDLNDFGVRQSSFNLGIIGMGLVEYQDMLPMVFSNPHSDISSDGYLPVSQFHEYVGLLVSAKEAIARID